MSDLELTLRALQPAWPETPDIAARVDTVIREPRRAPAPMPRRGLALVLAAVLVLGTGTAYAAIPSLRDFVRDLFGGTVEVEEVPRLPRAPADAALGIGPRVGLGEAGRLAGFDPVYPRLNEEPRFYATRHRFAAVYGSGAERRLFTAFPGDLEFRFINKMVGPGTEVRRVSVVDSQGLWLEGDPHIFIYRRPDDEIVGERVRLVSNTLVWPRGDLVLRFEGAKTLDEALRAARSVR